VADSIVVFPQEDVAGSGPVGDGEHVVREGECISLLAAKHGLKASDIFDHPDNAELKAVRRNPNVLLPRDRVAVRQVELKEQGRPTNQKSTFQLLREPVFLQIQILDRDQPVAGKPFALTVDGVTIRGTTNPDGTIKVRISPTATAGFLLVGPPDNLLQMKLKLGALHPVETNTGVQQRLQNLGFDCGPIDGIVGPRTRGRIRDFQGKSGLTIDGKLDPATRELLRQKHGC